MTVDDIWLVVLSWNGRDDTLDLLDTLTAEPATIVVVDNGSSDGTPAAVRARHPEVVVVETHANLGYAGGNNVGIAHAIAAGARWVGVLNNDTRVHRGFLAPLLAELRLAPAARAVSPDIRYADDPGSSWFRGGRLDAPTGSPVHLGAAEQPPADGGSFVTEVLSGCCIVAAAQVWERVGPFDERLFLVFEDSDWSLRARRLGVELRVVPASRIEHRVSRSFVGAAARLGTYYFARNGVVFAWRHLGGRATTRFVGARVVRPVLRTAVRDRTSGPVVMASLGLAAAVAGRRGRAGRWVEAAARHLARRSAGRSNGSMSTAVGARRGHNAGDNGWKSRSTRQVSVDGSQHDAK